MKNAVVVSALRTPIGRVPGSFSSLSEAGLMSHCMKAVVTSSDIESRLIDCVYVGCSYPPNSYNVARKSLLDAGLPQTIPGVTINCHCNASSEALVQGANAIVTGDHEIVLVGGVDCMSKSSNSIGILKRNIKAMLRNQLPSFDSIDENYDETQVNIVSEVLARKYGISRREQDEFACRSHQKAAHAYDKGYFNKEILPIDVEFEGVIKSVRRDENILENIDIEAVMNEGSICLKDGTVTQFNSSHVGDGAAAMIIMSEDRARKEGIKPIAKIISSSIVGVDRENIGMGASAAAGKLLKKLKMEIKDIQFVELNEPFAGIAIANQYIMNIADDRLNIQGGSIGLGYPGGCTGMRMCVTLLHSMQRLQSEFGLVALNSTGGMGQSILFGLS